VSRPLLALVLCGLALAAPGADAASDAVIVAPGAATGALHPRNFPARTVNAQGGYDSGAATLEALRWSGWGSPAARATGVLRHCPASRACTTRRVTVVADQLVKTGCGDVSFSLYTRLRLAPPVAGVRTPVHGVRGLC
jgi:hypothetical protein